MTLPAWAVESREAAGGVPAARLCRRGLTQSGMPLHALAVLEALQFDSPGATRLRALDDAGFGKVLQFCDPAQLTLTLNHACREALPAWVRDRIDRNIQDYSRRFERLTISLFEIARKLESAGIEFTVLKGVAHSPEFSPDPLLRAQGDIDIWCKPDSVWQARDALAELGYVPLGSRRERHLPPMIRQTRWQWQGDYFASDLPIAVELHDRLWDEHAEAISVPGIQDFWARRTVASVEGHALPVLSKVDALGFSALHLLMHILHGDVRLQRAWEIARFLGLHASEDSFWELWSRCHSGPLRRIEAIIFQLVSDWFGNRCPPAVAEEAGRLPEAVRLWLEHYGLAPIEALFHPNKDEVWLQLCLVESLRDRCAILRRRVFPVRPPARVDEAVARHVAPTPGQVKRHLLFVGSRAVHHARALVPVLKGGAKWGWLRTGLDAGFLRFQAASALYCLGMSIFFLLYNLHLLERGFHEKLLGQVSSSLNVGTLLGAFPAAAITRRIGLRNTVLIAVLGGAAAGFLRVLSAGQAWLLITALLHGMFLSLWAVSYQPAIAGLSSGRNRRIAFSLACTAGMCVGILGGVVGGRLPGVLSRVAGAPGPAEATGAALLLASAFAALAVLPAAGLRFPFPDRVEAKVFPDPRFLRGFFLSVLCWSAAVGAFNPFFNAFFAERWRMGVSHIGLVYSCGQAVQVLAVLSAPLVLRRLGDVKGIASMQVLTGGALAVLALSPNAGVAAAVYVGYMSFQYMSEPGLFSMLMSRVGPGERGGASALYFVATSIAGAISAFASGAAISRFGYAVVLTLSAFLAAAAALLFRTQVYEPAAAITSPTSS